MDFPLNLRESSRVGEALPRHFSWKHCFDYTPFGQDLWEKTNLSHFWTIVTFRNIIYALQKTSGGLTNYSRQTTRNRIEIV